MELENEMSDWLACDYKDMGLKNAIRLTVHTMDMVSVIKNLNEKVLPNTTRVS